MAPEGRGGGGHQGVSWDLRQWAESFEELLVKLANAEGAKLADVANDFASHVTLWGKKRGALLSSARVGDGEVVIQIIKDATVIRNVISAHAHWHESRTTQAANTFVLTMSRVDSEIKDRVSPAVLGELHPQ